MCSSDGMGLGSDSPLLAATQSSCVLRSTSLSPPGHPAKPKKLGLVGPGHGPSRANPNNEPRLTMARGLAITPRFFLVIDGVTRPHVSNLHRNSGAGCNQINRAVSRSSFPSFNVVAR